MGIIAPAALFSANAMSIRTTLKHRYESLAYPKATLIIGVVLLFGLIWLLVSGGEDAPTAPAALKTVTVATVSELSGDGSTLTVVGDLRAASQADLRMERAGRVTGIYAKSGDRVAAGAVIAEIENASERARVLSAQGSLQGAQAALAKLLAGDRPEDRASTEADLKSAEQSLSQAKLSAVTAFRQGYANAYPAFTTGWFDFLWARQDTTTNQVAKEFTFTDNGLYLLQTPSALLGDELEFSAKTTSAESEATVVIGCKVAF